MRSSGVARRSTAIPVVMAVNREYAPDARVSSAGDEVALIPPVSGGSVSAAHVRVTNEPLRLDPLLEPPCATRAPAPWSPSSA